MLSTEATLPDDSIDRLLATIPFWARQRGRKLVVKLGGSAMEDPAGLESTLTDVAWLAILGQRVVLVHGGGKAIDRALQDQHIEPRKVNGRRVTDDATLAVVVEVLGRQINSDIVGRLRDLGIAAVGESDLLTPEPLDADLGWVGRVSQIEIAKLNADAGVVVIPPIARDSAGQWWNINGDDVASAVAVNWHADELVFLTDTPGLMMDRHDPTTRIARLSPSEARALLDSGVAAGGMAPKVEGCLDALRRGVGRVVIVDGRVPHALLHEGFGRPWPGTMFVNPS